MLISSGGKTVNKHIFYLSFTYVQTWLSAAAVQGREGGSALACWPASGAAVALSPTAAARWTGAGSAGGCWPLQAHMHTGRRRPCLHAREQGRGTGRHRATAQVRRRGNRARTREGAVVAPGGRRRRRRPRHGVPRRRRRREVRETTNGHVFTKRMTRRCRGRRDLPCGGDGFRRRRPRWP